MVRNLDVFLEAIMSCWKVGEHGDHTMKFKEKFKRRDAF